MTRHEPDPGSEPQKHFRLTTFASLAIRDYRMYWLGLIAAFSGLQMQVVARGWLVYDMSRSPLALGLVSACFGIPVLFLSPLGGTIADRLDKRKILILAHLFNCLVTLPIAVLIYLDLIRIWHLMTAAFLVGISFVFNGPARMAIIPELVDRGRLMNAVSLNSSAMNLTRVVAPSIGGMLIPVMGISGVYYLVVGLYGLAVAAMYMISRRREIDPSHKDANAEPEGEGQDLGRPGPSSRGIWGDLGEGFRFMRRSPLIMSLMAMALIPMAFGLPYLILMPIFAKDIFHMGPQGLGFLMGAGGAGALAGSMVIASLGDYRQKGRLLMVLAVGFGVTLCLFGLSHRFLLSLGILVALGACGSGYMAVNNTLIQTNTPQMMLGRIMSIYMISFAAMPLGAIPISAVAEAIGADTAVAIGGTINLVFMLAMFAIFPSLRRLT